MSRDARMYLEDMLEACRKIAIYVDGMSRDQFELDSRTYDAVVRNLEIVGEAAKRRNMFPTKRDNGWPTSNGEKSRDFGTYWPTPTLASTMTFFGTS